VVLLFWVLQSATGFTGRSLMAAALFAMHPINVESVAWVAERKNLLSMMFFLLALAAYRWYAERPQVARYLVCALMFSLGLMSKPQVITLPFVLLLWDYWPLRRVAVREGRFLWLVMEKLPLFAISAASAVVTLRAQRAGGAIALFRIPLTIRLANAALAYARYLEDAIWPSRLAVFYPHPLGAALGWPAAVSAVGLLLITVLVVRAREQRYLLVGWFWFLGTLVPMIGLVQVGTQAMADRYAYLPLVGLYLMICWGVAELAQRRRLASAVVPAVSLAAILALMVVTYRQLGYWQDDVTLWSHAAQVTRGNYVAEDNLGEALVDEGKMEEAMPHFFRAVAILPADPTGNLNIGAYEQAHQNFPSAIAQYSQVLRYSTNTAVRRKALMNMADAYEALGDTARAGECREAAEKIGSR
jgi:tetratricopeptide (TPR) repeat protein